jgi:hypothetical protein
MFTSLIFSRQESCHREQAPGNKYGTGQTGACNHAAVRKPDSGYDLAPYTLVFFLI